MSLISKNIPNLINGVSQQPPSLRLDSQAEEQINGLSDVVTGLRKRPPSEYINTLRKGTPTGDAVSSTEVNRSYIHSYKRSNEEQYTVMYDPTSEKMRVYDITGNLRYENGVGSWDSNGSLISANTDDVSYLSGATANDIASTSVSDSTFLVNKLKVVERDETSPDNVRPHEGMFYLKKSNYGKVYRAKLLDTSGVQLETGYWETKDGDDPNQVDTLRTGNIMTTMCGLTNESSFAASAVRMSVPAGFTRYADNGLPFFTFSNSTTDFIIEATDEDGGNSLFTHKDTVATFTTLPKYCQENFTIAVIGDNQKKEDNFYVRYDGTNTAGSWKECPAPSRPNNPVYHSFDSATLPHTLKQNGDLSFTFGVPKDSDGNDSWSSRKAGDDDTNPFPSFVGGTINDVFFYRNRLGFLSDENVIFSEASSFFNFFRVTVRSLLDSDVIDVAVSSDIVSVLKKAIPFSEQLLLLSDGAQFNLSSGSLLTPTEVAVSLSTTYEFDLSVPPVSSGTSVYIPRDKGVSLGISEYFVSSDTERNTAEDITGNIPTYIQGSITDMVVSSNEDTLAITTDADPKAIFVYRWYISDGQRVQSAWSKWVMQGDVSHMFFNGTDFKVILGYGDESHVENINLSEDEAVSVTASSHPVLLDRRVKLESVSDTVPYTDADIQYVTTAGKIVTSPTTYPVYAGVPYTFSYKFSEQVFRPDTNKPVTIARYQLRNFNIVYSDTSTFDVTVEAVGRDPVVSTFTGNLLGSSSFVLGTANVVPNGTYKVGIGSQASEVDVTLSSTSPLPCNFTSVEVEGFVTVRSQRI